MKKENDIFRNGSGYKDPTAGKAIKNVDNEPKRRANQLINALQIMAHLSGFEILGRIELKDYKTGKIWR